MMLVFTRECFSEREIRLACLPEGCLHFTGGLGKFQPTVGSSVSRLWVLDCVSVERELSANDAGIYFSLLFTVLVTRLAV